MSDTALSRQDRASAYAELRRRKLVAFLFVAPLLAFLLFAFVAPIASMLFRSVYEPTVADLIPETLDKLSDWDGQSTPAPEVMTQMAIDLKRLANERTSGRLAGEVNRSLPGASSVIQSTARQLRPIDDQELAISGAQSLIQANPRWNDVEIWRSIERVGQAYKIDQYLTALDLQKNPVDGSIEARDGPKIYVDLYTKTLRIALLITLLTIALGYPLSYYLAGLPDKTANLLIVFVLLPFWTSLLVRTTSWIALLQTNGVVNSFLMSIGIINAPMEMLYTEFATVIAMTHILLPFMILPLYSVMRGIDPSYYRAALSMGARPIPAFLRIYLPMSLPGLSAGALLVFIISVGYYITPALVGGTEGQMISNLIAFHMQQSNNWGLAAALGSILLAVILLLYWTYDRFVGTKNLSFG
ncbi:MAG: ABC transporter permease [Burkholderiaceae bacterium]|nr:ABC transporter permease [Burkholderiaceae bacterium]MCD8516668.1 ABC transporter permease [Burkholderiaceae bacterium]MCD8536312.1 ABC transporter permease [Burkholderiaceae bacterium]